MGLHAHIFVGDKRGRTHSVIVFLWEVISETGRQCNFGTHQGTHLFHQGKDFCKRTIPFLRKQLFTKVLGHKNFFI